ncbi:hypothetical protein ILUMI_12301 [Ignelater luminosus]|uniref:Transposable element P transposase-like RNase H domain-containing protein n=1 Tax=Ignelater luminosus TaxID=2038154 RepID=A0A8K0CUD5_IGNLU|nr:hypothetical protein ILUMI_12301 [Ignelater luminosus]
MVAGSPRCNKESPTALKLRSSDAKEKGRTLLCCLVLNEMSIIKQVESTEQKFNGHVDIRTKIDSNELSEANKALENIAVNVNSAVFDTMPKNKCANITESCLLQGIIMAWVGHTSWTKIFRDAKSESVAKAKSL